MGVEGESQTRNAPWLIRVFNPDTWRVQRHSVRGFWSRDPLKVRNQPSTSTLAAIQEVGKTTGLPSLWLWPFFRTSWADDAGDLGSELWGRAGSRMRQTVVGFCGFWASLFQHDAFNNAAFTEMLAEP